MADIEKTVDVIFSSVDRTAEGFNSVNSNFENIIKGAAGLSEPLARVADFALKAQTAVVALGATFLTSAVSSASKFGEKIEEIGSLVNNTTDQNKKLSDSVLDFAKNVNGIGSTSGLDQINEALYNATSNVGSTSKAFEILQIAEMGAQVGATDLNTAATLLTGTMNAYGLVTDDSATNTANAERIMAAMFATVQNGKTTMIELEGSLGRVASTAAAAGVPIEIVGSAISALTAANVSTDESMTLLNSLFKELLAPGTELVKVLGDLSVTTDGLPTILKRLETVTGGNAQEFFKLFTSSEAARGAMILANDNAGKFSGTMELMKTDTEAFNSSYSVMVGGVADSTKKLANEFKSLHIKIGQPLQDTWASVLDGLSNISQGIETSIDAGTFEPVFNAFKGFETEIAGVLNNIAKNLPEALGQVDFAGLIAALKDLGFEFGDIFKGLDITTPRGLADAIQFAVDSLKSLANVAAGIIDVWGPVIRGFVSGIQVFNDLDDSSQKTSGQLAGLSQVFQTLKGSLEAGGSAISDLGQLFKGTFGIISESISMGAFVVLGLSTGTLGVSIALDALFVTLKAFVPALTPVIDLIQTGVTAWTLYQVATKGAALATATYSEATLLLANPIVQIVAALAAVGWGIKQNVDAWTEYQNRQQTVKDSTQNLADSQDKIGAKLAQISDSTGITVKSMDELNKAMDNGLITMDKTTGVYSATALGVKEFGVTLDTSTKSNTSWADSVNSVANNMLGLGKATDSVIIPFMSLAAAEKFALDEMNKGRDISIAYEDGLYNLTSTQKATTDSTDKLAKATKDAAKATIEGTTEWKNVQDVMIATQKTTDDFVVKMGELGNKRYEINVRAAVDLKTAEIVADTARIGEAMKASTTTIGELVGSVNELWGIFSKVAGFTGSDEIKQAALNQERRLDEELALKREETEAIVAKMQAEAFRLESGEPLISIDARELAPELELVFDKILKYTQIKATQQGLSLLVGLS